MGLGKHVVHDFVDMVGVVRAIVFQTPVVPPALSGKAVIGESVLYKGRLVRAFRTVPRGRPVAQLTLHRQAPVSLLNVSLFFGQGGQLYFWIADCACEPTFSLTDILYKWPYLQPGSGKIKRNQFQAPEKKPFSSFKIYEFTITQLKHASSSDPAVS